MDYGYQLLRHIVQQVFGNLKQAAQLTLLLFLAPLIGFLILGGGMSMGLAGAPSGGAILAGLGLIVGVVIAYCWAAVGWHRYVLLEETGNGVVPPWRGDRIMAYFGRAFVVGVLVVLAVLGGGVAVGIAVALTQSASVAIVMGIGLVLGASWVATRIGLVLPAAALGAPMTIGTSWSITRPVASQILLPLIVVALVVGVAQQLILVVFGQTVRVETFGMVQDQTTLSVLGQILNAGVSWLQILINLALMTTLYGNLVEGRPLN